MKITKSEISAKQLEKLFARKHGVKDNHKPADDSMTFIGTKEISQLMGCSIPVARQIMYRKDFPLVKCGKNLKVMKSEFIKWASERRV